MIEPYFDSNELIRDSIASQTEAIRAKTILAEARLNRLVDFFERRSHKSQGL